MGIKVVANNKKAFHDYFIEEKYEAGLVLQGTEVKSLREAAVNLRDSYCRIRGGEIFVENMHISPYDFGNRENHDPLRSRKLLLHAEEIRKLTKKVEEKGLSLVPTRLYFKEGRAKLEIGVARGKKLHDKRQTLRQKQDAREMARAMRGRL
ncbi:SsrA-binding protein SmpB [Geothermobacter hydrogeniphilus]|uniref:SsrA-binding protein n=1 Tax=Geothermobacter hydrogeniphilus TaxID=1969733 RepID=A0A1X0Y8Z5_9BACT|nr:SsrA-binding protein SmpB [Geothermobacter hydrogeniphilus]ORJ61606.1 SsrA-binding protein [Geothermobacter hydrogeniphilus]